jgi:hypothetical protein
MTILKSMDLTAVKSNLLGFSFLREPPAFIDHALA